MGRVSLHYDYGLALEFNTKESTFQILANILLTYNHKLDEGKAVPPVRICSARQLAHASVDGK
jgi:hypothetical protein